MFSHLQEISNEHNIIEQSTKALVKNEEHKSCTNNSCWKENTYVWKVAAAFSTFYQRVTLNIFVGQNTCLKKYCYTRDENVNVREDHCHFQILFHKRLHYGGGRDLNNRSVDGRWSERLDYLSFVTTTTTWTDSLCCWYGSIVYTVLVYQYRVITTN